MKKLFQGLILMSFLFPAQAQSVSLSWDLPEPISNQPLTGFRVFRAEVINGVIGTWNQVGIDVPFPGVTFTDPTVLAGKSYWYSVTSFDALDESVPSNLVLIAVPVQPPPPAPVPAKLQPPKNLRATP